MTTPSRTRERLVRAGWHAVGTACSAAVTAAPRDSRRAAAALAAARAEVAACEAELSRFDPASGLSRLNAAAGDWAPVGPRLLDALRLALLAREETDGRFDPTILPALAAAGYDRTFGDLRERAPQDPTGPAGAEIELDAVAGAARLEPGAAVDLGGIGKGYAAGRAVDAMFDAWPGLPGGLVDLGGDIAARGTPPGGGFWRIAVADPRRPGTTLATLLVRGGGVATSGRDVRRFGPGGSLHHLIDPLTGRPAAPGPLAVTVVAPSAVDAEVNATALAIAAPADAAAHVDARPRLAALYVPADGPVLPLGEPPLAAARIVVRAA